MEVFSRFLEEIASKKEFEYQWKCKKSKISHLCLANNLLIFCKVEVNSVKLIKEVLDRFHSWSGFQSKRKKKKAVLDILYFEEGALPFK